jgi:hypothetical protein
MGLVMKAAMKMPTMMSRTILVKEKADNCRGCSSNLNWLEIFGRNALSSSLLLYLREMERLFRNLRPRMDFRFVLVESAAGRRA